MSAARVAQRLPDPAATATMIATAEHLLLQLPGAAKPGDDRTETPPSQYWRRWSEDAAPPSPGPARAAPPSPAQPEAPPPVELPPMGGNGDEPPYRVLIVEDDRAQALFAEGVLNGAGIEALVASEPREVMDIMTRTRPDLVLMDLHMPGMSGTELTTMIRQHEAFLHTPIVFLTGDPDPDKQFEVLEMGADDLLQKPIRPRHLVAAIESRVKRARALGKQRMSESSRHPATGLMARPHLLQRLGAALPAVHGGGVYFIEVEGSGTLRDRFGYAALEHLMTEAGRRLGELAGAHPATRLNDHSFLVFSPDLDDAQLDALARRHRPASLRTRRPHAAPARDGGLRGVAPWLHGSGQRAGGGGIRGAPRALAIRRRGRLCPAGSGADERSVGLSARCAGRRPFRTDLPTHRRRRRRG